MKRSAEQQHQPVLALMRFIERMNQWEKLCLKTNDFHHSALAAVFRDCCTPRAQGGGRLLAAFFNDPPDYDVAKEKVIEVVQNSKTRVSIHTSAFKGEFPWEYSYVLRLTAGRWLIDGKKTLRHGKTLKALL